MNIFDFMAPPPNQDATPLCYNLRVMSFNLCYLPNKISKLKGIYKIEGDKLFFCYAYNPELDRPKKFKTDLGENYYLYELKKINEWKWLHKRYRRTPPQTRSQDE